MFSLFWDTLPAEEDGDGLGQCEHCHAGGDDGAPVIPRTKAEFLEYLLNTAIADCFDQKLVVPGDIENSSLVKLLEQTCEDPNLVMPLAPFPLYPAEIADVKSWIAAGAEDN